MKKKFLFLTLFLSFASFAYTLINAELPSMIGIDDTNQIDLIKANEIIADPIQDTMTINSADLNAKFHSLNMKIAKLKCDNKGGIFNESDLSCSLESWSAISGNWDFSYGNIGKSDTEANQDAIFSQDLTGNFSVEFDMEASSVDATLGIRIKDQVYSSAYTGAFGFYNAGEIYPVENGSFIYVGMGSSDTGIFKLIVSDDSSNQGMKKVEYFIDGTLKRTTSNVDPEEIYNVFIMFNYPKPEQVLKGLTITEL